jgi:FADH2 O2-dependent halogenase
MESGAGPGWILVGDAFRFIDPIFSSGVDVALFSSLYAYEALTEAMGTGNEERAFAAYQRRLETGVDIWYELIDTFYTLQNLVTYHATSPRWRETIVRALQGNPYIPETQTRARILLDVMHEAYEKALADPGNLLRPWALDPEKGDIPRCPECLGVVDYVASEGSYVCRKCGARRETAPEAGFLTTLRSKS